MIRKGQVSGVSRMVVSVIVTLFIIKTALDVSTAVDDKIRMESLGMVEQRIEGNTLMISQVENGMVEMELRSPYKLTSNNVLKYSSESSLIAITGVTVSKKKINFPVQPTRVVPGTSSVFCIANSEAVKPKFQVAATTCDALIEG